MKPPVPCDPDLTPLLTVAEVATYLHVRTRTVRRLIDSKELQAIRIGRLARVSEEVLKVLLT
jgi:excisionase family DNA binding protein